MTLENPWRDNLPSISCIPPGIYEVLRCRKSPEYGFRDSPRFGDTYNVVNVPGRSYILFHKGNTERDTKGCILVGTYFGELAGLPAVLRSSDAFDRFKAWADRDERFTLEISNPSVG